ncbi:MAG TPA: hypothetical protein VMI54_20105 [Polyangiaceae bacterium]|nr:hypothetical protein [Polyangiaceae bacterium]
MATRKTRTAAKPRTKAAEPAPKGQAPLSDDTSDLVKYVLVELDVPTKHHAEFQEKMRQLVEVMFDFKRWELVFASYPLTGTVNRFVHIWRIPDESTILQVMRKGAVRLTQAVKRNPTTLSEEFQVCYEAVQSLINETKHTLMTSLEYDPASVGYQTQTILIDAEGDLSIINHKKLRGELPPAPQSSSAWRSPDTVGIDHDIAEQLELLRLHRFSPVRSIDDVQGKSLPHAKSPANRLDRKGLTEIQKHLNRGAVTAQVGRGTNQTLLFNLAALKARSVFQELSAPTPASAEVTGKTVKVALPPNVDQLMIATPWGSVYALDGDALNQIAESIPTKRHDGTERIVKPIIDDRLPIASIQAERNEIVGDGCDCYVINLQSFVSNNVPGTFSPREKRRAAARPRKGAGRAPRK